MEQIPVRHATAQVCSNVVAGDDIVGRAPMEHDSSAIAADEIALAQWTRAEVAAAPDGIAATEAKHVNAVAWEIKDLEPSNDIAGGSDCKTAFESLVVPGGDQDGHRHHVGRNDGRKAVWRPVGLTADQLQVLQSLGAAIGPLPEDMCPSNPSGALELRPESDGRLGARNSRNPVIGILRIANSVIEKQDPDIVRH